MGKHNQSVLVERNDVALTAQGYWSMKGQKGFGYTDGAAAEEGLRRIIAQASDRSSLSLELENASFDWITDYHLSGDRANIYRFLQMDQIQSGLELGAGCGAITRFLGESGLQLDAVEGSEARAEICRLRCEGLDNVHIIQANFNELNLPDNHYDAVFFNGVLEYAGMFLDGSLPAKAAVGKILQKALTTLKEDGVLCIAIENRVGLKYWLGAREDHYGVPYYGIYDYPENIGITTFDRSQWHEIIQESLSDFHHQFIYPFPDYKMAKTILSERFVRQNGHVYNHLYRVGATDNGVPVKHAMNESLLWESLHRHGNLEDFANSFFILLSKNKKRIEELSPYDFKHFSGKGRKAQFRTVTSKRSGSDQVIKEYVHQSSPLETSKLHHDLGADTYTDGPLLVNRWLHALTAGDYKGLENNVEEYYHYLQNLFTDDGEHNNLFDVLPFNIVVDENGNWVNIDKEWVVDVPLTPEFLLFRALFWFPGGNESILSSFLHEHKISTILEFIQYFFNHLRLPLDNQLDGYVQSEEFLQLQIAHQVRENPIQNMLVQPMRQAGDAELSLSFLTQLYWSGENDAFSEDKSVFEPGRVGASQQQIVFTLPASPDSPVAMLRFDPADRAGFFRINHLTIQPADQEQSQLAWSLTGNDGVAQFCQLAGLEYCRSGLGDTFISTGNDPHLILHLPDEVKAWTQNHGIVFTVSMDWPKSADYLVVMDSLGKQVVEHKAELDRLYGVEKLSENQVVRISEQAAQLKEKNDQVRSKDIYIDNLEREIEAMRQTKVWRMAEYLRMKVYYRLLDTKTLAQKGVKTLRNEGVKQFLRKAKQQIVRTPDSDTLGLNRTDYNLWVEHTRLTEYDIERIKENIDNFSIKPLFSIIVPVYNVDQEWLERTIDSVRSQLYENWELCLCDDLSPSPHIKKVLEQYAGLDERIKIMLKEKNEGIAITSNAALTMATGDYVALLDHDDELSIDALYENGRVINSDPGAGLIYSDEDKLDMQGRRCDPFFKPDYSPELIRSQNYICHFTVIKKTILDELGGFRKGYDGSQDHDLILRALEKTKKVHHIPKILYHWRKIPGSTAAVYDSKSYAWEAGRKAIEDSLERQGIAGSTVFAQYQGSYRVRPELKDRPLVSIIMPFKDKPDLLKTAIESILAQSTYENFEILGMSNNSGEEATHRLMDELSKRDSRVRFIEYNVPFNYSAINNHAVTFAKGEYLLLLNNDIEIISPEWLEALLEVAQFPGVGAVGGKLYYPDDRIQHVGLVIGMAGVAGPPHYLFHKSDVGYYARAHIIHNVSAVTGACLMVKKELYESVSGMDEENFGVAYNDVDFCLKLAEKGFRNVVTPYCEMYHYESQSRGYEDTPEKQQRLQKESDAFNTKWQEYIQKGDPYHNPHLSLEKTNYSIRLAS